MFCLMGEAFNATRAPSPAHPLALALRQFVRPQTQRFLPVEGPATCTTDRSALSFIALYVELRGAKNLAKIFVTTFMPEADRAATIMRNFKYKTERDGEWKGREGTGATERQSRSRGR